MIITISGKAGSGKSTVAKIIAKKLSLKHYSTGELMRELAKEHDVSLIKFSKMAETDKSIDKELDERQVKLGQEKNDFVIDGRLAAYFIPNADFKFFLDAKPEIRAKRILEDNRDEEKSKNLKEMLKKIEKRESSEAKRYKEYYNVDYENEDLYDHVIDTSELNIEEVIDNIISIIEN